MFPFQYNLYKASSIDTRTIAFFSPLWMVAGGTLATKLDEDGETTEAKRRIRDLKTREDISRRHPLPLQFSLNKWLLGDLIRISKLEKTSQEPSIL